LFSDDQIATIFKLKTEGKFNVPQLANKYKCTIRTIFSLMKKYRDKYININSELSDKLS